MKKIILSLIVFIITLSANATHIIGGEIQYEHLGGASYKLTVKLYRDCDPTSVDFPNDAIVQVDFGNGVSDTFFVLPRLGRDTLNPPIDTCAFDPGVCVEQAIYSSIVSLPPSVEGYHLYSHYCCRNGSINNILNPLGALELFYAYIPDNNIYLTNSSPIITNFPPVFVCNNQNLNLDFGASDLDGDSLVYSFYTPYDGDDGSYTYYSGVSYIAGPAAPDNFQSTTVTYLPGYSTNSPLDPFGGPGLFINPTTGLITGSPVMLGQFVVGVMVNEYRDGNLVGRVTRDFQMNVLNCPPPQQAAIGPTDGCSGTAITFVNNSGAGANGFYWDFDNLQPNVVPTDTSILFEPTHTYPALGTYNVTLIAQKGTSCADTAYYTLNVSGITPSFSMPDTVCVGESFTISETTTVLSGTVGPWEWDFGDANTSNIQNPSHSYLANGDYNVQLIVHSSDGCTDTLIKPIHVRVPPLAGIVPLPGCNGLSVNFTSNSDPNASGFWWSFGTGFPADTANTENSSFTYANYGSFNVQLIAQKGTACADTATYSIDLTEFIPDFLDLDTVCVNSVVNFTDQTTVSNGTVTNWSWNFGDGSTSTAQNPSHGYSSAGDFNVQLIATSSLGCVDSITKVQHVMIAPVAQIGAVDACSGLEISFNNFSDPTATDFWWDFGTGNPADSSIVFEPTFTYPGFGSYTVTLIAQKGTGCQTQDTYVVNISELTAGFNMPDTACANTIVSMTDESISAATITQWEWDFGDGTTSLNEDETHIYPVGGDYIVELVVTSSVGCTDTLLSPLFIQGAIIVDAGIDTALCVAAPALTLNGQVSNASGGIWTGGLGSFNLNPTQLGATYNPTLAEVLGGQVELVLTSTGNGFCPATSDTIVITYLENPSVDAGLDIDVCADSLFMNISGVATNAVGTTWTTSGTGVFGDATILTTTYTPTPLDVANGFVNLYINTSNNSGCPNAVDSLYIFFNPAPTVSIVSTDTTCANYEVLLESNSSTNNGWWETLGDGDFTPSDTGVTTFYVNGPNDLSIGYVDIVFNSLDNGGCKVVKDTTHIVIIPSPIVDFSATTVCEGNPTVFGDLSTSVETITNWDWIFEAGQTSINQNPSYTFTSGIGLVPVQLVVTSLNGCIDTLIKDVLIFDTPQVNFVSPEPCLYGAIFIDSSMVSDTTITSWSWDFGDGLTSNEQNPIHPFDEAGSYNVTLTVVSANGCTSNGTIVTEVYPAPEAEFTASPNPGEVSEEIQFTDESTSSNSTIVTWLWQFQDGDSSDVQNPTNTYDDAGAYNVQLLIFDAFGCRDTVENIVNIMYGPDVPTAFSPNGDQQNDFAMVLGGVFEEIDFKIYNNWGEIIYETQDVNALGWDGKNKGEDQPIGVYVYTAIVKTADGAVVKISGDITLIR